MNIHTDLFGYWDPKMDENIEAIIVEMMDFAVGYEPITITPMKDASNKWLARSGLQKAIRQGDVDTAVKCAGWLASVDYEYLWRSLAIVAIEDVGFGYPDFISYTTIACQNKKKVRYADWSLQLLSGLITKACNSLKSRACCELASIVTTQHGSLFFDYSKMTTDELVDIACNNDPLESFAALSVLRKVVPGYVKPKRPKDVEGVQKVLESVFETDMPFKLKRAAMLAFESPQDDMSMSAIPIFKECNEIVEDEMSISFRDLKIDRCRIKGIDASSYDMHTSQGKIALKAFYTSLSKVYPSQMSELEADIVVPYLGEIVFFLEGGLIDQFVDLPYFNALRDSEFWVCINRYKVPHEVTVQMLDIVSSEFNRLNDKRIWASELDR